MKKTIAVVGILFVLVILLISGIHIDEAPKNIYTAPSNDQNLVQWKEDWTKAGDSIVSVDVVSIESDRIFVNVEYIYSGKYGPEVTTCGNIMREVRSGDWYCEPTGIRKGRGFVTLRFGTTEASSKVLCSKTIRVNFYHNRKTFFAQDFPFEKKWVTIKWPWFWKIYEHFGKCED